MRLHAFCFLFLGHSLLLAPLEAQLDPDLEYCRLATQYFSVREDAQIGDDVARLRIGTKYGGSGESGSFGDVRIALAASASGRNDNEFFEFDSISLNVSL